MRGEAAVCSYLQTSRNSVLSGPLLHLPSGLWDSQLRLTVCPGFGAMHTSPPSFEPVEIPTRGIQKLNWVSPCQPRMA